MDKKISGEWAWLGLALAITSYDVYAVKSKKIETLSTALWKSLAHPKKRPASMIIWGGLTWHLFGNDKARQSYRIHFQNKKAIK